MKKVSAVVLFIAFATTVFAQMGDMSLIPYRSGSKWGFASTDRKVVITPKYDDAKWFHNGLAAVKVGSKWGYINTAGKMVIPARYTVAKAFSKGFVPKTNDPGGDSILFAGVSVRTDGYEVCIDSKGRNLKGCPAISEAKQNAEPDGYVLQKKTYSLPNNDGMFDEIVDDYMAGTEHYYIARKGGAYGVFNSKFDMAMPFEYSSIKMAKWGASNVLVAEKGGMYGVYDQMGNNIIPSDYQSATVVTDNMMKPYVIVKQNGRAFILDQTGKNIMNRGYGDITYDPNGGFVLTGDNNLKGFYFTDNTYIQPKYTSVQLMPGGGYLMVKAFNGAEGYINTRGDEYFTQ